MAKKPKAKPKTPEPVKTPEPEPKRRASRSELSLKKVNLERLQRQFENVLSREAVHLLKISHKSKLDRDGANALSSYLKLLKDLRKAELEDLDNLSDEELEKLANNG